MDSKKLEQQQAWMGNTVAAQGAGLPRQYFEQLGQGKVSPKQAKQSGDAYLDSYYANWLQRAAAGDVGRMASLPGTPRIDNMGGSYDQLKTQNLGSFLASILFGPKPLPALGDEPKMRANQQLRQ